jgi:hypothetical protein
VDVEVARRAFADERLGKRLCVLLEQMGGVVGESLPMGKRRPGTLQKSN